MATELKLRRGSTTQNNGFTGASGEITVDETKKTVVVHDNTTAGGNPLATEADLTTLDNAAVKTTGNQTIAGNKTFSANTDFSAGIDVTGNITSTAGITAETIVLDSASNEISLGASGNRALIKSDTHLKMNTPKNFILKGSLVDLNGDSQTPLFQFQPDGTNTVFQLGTTGGSLTGNLNVSGGTLEVTGAVKADSIELDQRQDAPAAATSGDMYFDSDTQSLYVRRTPSGGTAEWSRVTTESSEFIQFKQTQTLSVTPQVGMIYFDSDDQKLKVYTSTNGGQFENLN